MITAPDIYTVPLFHKLPLAESVRLYVESHIPAGHFLSAVISNDLLEAVKRGDDDNLAALADYVRWFYWHAPGDCWGSQAAMKRWLSEERL